MHDVPDTRLNSLAHLSIPPLPARGGTPLLAIVESRIARIAPMICRPSPTAHRRRRRRARRALLPRSPAAFPPLLWGG
jgi:hypothetical protein